MSIMVYYFFYIFINYYVLIFFNRLPSDKISEMSKFKAVSNDELNVIQMAGLVFEQVENFAGKEETAGYHHLSPFP